ncbi:MAG: hypothetical protein KBS83_05850 [Lachnospiraceae bacterium]|nr:hypothetical protein [Candidatus Equihabitans merdae]
MKWAEHLYIGKRIEDRYPKVRAALDASKRPAYCYLLTLPTSQYNQLEIIHSFQFYKNKPYIKMPLIVGLAADYDESRQLVMSITNEVYQATGDVDIRSYILQREGST